MAQNESNAFVSTESSEPIPGKDTFNGHDETLTIGGNGFEEGSGSGWQVAGQQDFALMAYDTAVHGAGVQVDPTVQWVLSGGESHEVSSFLRNQLFIPTTSIPLGYAEGEASYIINGLEPTPYSLRFAAAFGRGSGLALI
jgi:hypothetical protein